MQFARLSIDNGAGSLAQEVCTSNNGANCAGVTTLCWDNFKGRLVNNNGPTPYFFVNTDSKEF
jgi:hypothetical protein